MASLLKGDMKAVRNPNGPEACFAVLSVKERLSRGGFESLDAQGTGPGSFASFDSCCALQARLKRKSGRAVEAVEAEARRGGGFCCSPSLPRAKKGPFQERPLCEHL